MAVNNSYQPCNSQGRNLNRYSKSYFSFLQNRSKSATVSFIFFEIHTFLLHENVLTGCVEARALFQYGGQSLNSVSRLVNFFFVCDFWASEM